jgi:hypothetical protein
MHDLEVVSYTLSYLTAIQRVRFVSCQLHFLCATERETAALIQDLKVRHELKLKAEDF